MLRRYFMRYAEIARQQGLGFVLETPTWRANPDWGVRLGYDATALADANRQAIELLLDIRAEYETPETPIVISGNLGPRGDGYCVDSFMGVAAARDYHRLQIETFAQTDADMISALTLNYIEEAIGIVQAAREVNLPVAISFTVETDGCLPSGDCLADAIQRADDKTNGYAAYYMINCAHPTHFEHVLQEGGSWRERIRGLRANASKRSHAELDESTNLDSGDPQELGGQYRALLALLPQLTVLGGCCGTDHRHVEAIGEACMAPFESSLYANGN
jgi:homocysteine S-methyltransferase